MAEKKALENEEIKEYGQIELNENRQQHNIQLLSIIGEVEGHECLASNTKTTKYEHVLPKLAEAEDDRTVDGLLVLLNTVGGDVESGLAIAEMIASLSKPVVSLVLGGSHSIGVPLAVAADYSYIVPTGTMVIHPVRMSGTVIGAPQTYEYFQQMQDRITGFIASHCMVKQERIEELMLNTSMLTKDLGTILVGHQAVEEGIINEVEVKLSEKEWSVYDELRQEMVVSLEDEEIDAANAAALSGKLLQMSNGAIYNEEKEVFHIHDRKLDALEDLIEGANGKPILVAYWYNHDLKRIRERFEVREIKTSKDIRDWNNGDIPIGVIHPASAGHGLNLQSGGSTIIWFGLTWSLELYQQTNARLWRQGQKSTVVIHHIISKDTIDEDVMKALRLKEKTQTDLIDAVKARIGGGANGG